MNRKTGFNLALVITLFLSVGLGDLLSQEPQVKVGTSKGVRSRVAVADFQMRSSDPQLTQYTALFNEVLWNDLDMSGYSNSWLRVFTR